MALDEALKRNRNNLPVSVMFQDEARFGRLSLPQRCWAPAPLRPVVVQGVVREYSYAYAALAPMSGDLDWMMAPSMNTIEMGAFLRHVGKRHSDQFVVMVLDGAPSHRSLQLPVPDNMALVRLPPYSPELNPVEHLWDEIREKRFANRVFDSMGAVIAQALLSISSSREDATSCVT
ncbi:MAG: transposase [Verrucomicrobiota bacterium]